MPHASGPRSPTSTPEGRLAPPPSAPVLDRLARRLVVPFALGVASCLVLALWADVSDLQQELRSFDLLVLLPVLALSLVNYGLRFLRWQLYLAVARVSLSWWRSLEVFLVGFVLSVTPGKAGELAKAWLVRELGGGAARRVVPAVLAERLTDLLSVLALVVLGAGSLPGGRWIVTLGVTSMVGGVALLTWRRAVLWLLDVVASWPVLGSRVPLVRDVYLGMVRLLHPALLLPSLLLAVVAWAAEGVGFVLVVRSYDRQASLLRGIFDYGVATLAGALSMLPGGLLVSEGALAALLEERGLELAAAASATLITRAATLWFAVLLGLAALPAVLRSLRSRKRPPSEPADPFPPEPEAYDTLPASRGGRRAGSKHDRSSGSHAGQDRTAR